MNQKERRAREAHKQAPLGDAPVDAEYHGKMEFLARQMDHLFNGDLRGEHRKVGFVLMVFPFGEGGRANYVSNANRADIVATMKEQIARFEGQPEQSGTA